MANNPQFYDSTVIAALTAAAAVLNNGTIKIYTGTQPALDGGAGAGTLLATLTFGATAFATPTASSGTVTAVANSITAGTAGATGTAAWFALCDSGGTIRATGVCGTSGSDLNLNSLSISSGANVSCSSFSLTQPQT